MTDPTPPAEFTGTARLFPLPNLVLFPQVVQGLHIFEPRYKQLMNDVLAGDRLITLVLLKPGWEDDYDNSPAIEPVACLGQVTWHEKLDDGRFNLRVRGVARLRILEELQTDRPYRVARAEVIAESAPSDLSTLKTLRNALADLVLPQFTDEGPARRQLQELFEGEMPLGQVCDVLGYALPLTPEVKQSLLAESHSGRRAVALLEALRVAAARADRKFPPAFSPN
jgi:Lon protease-like protein